MPVEIQATKYHIIAPNLRAQLITLKPLNSSFYIFLLAAWHDPMITDSTNSFTHPPLAAVQSLRLPRLCFGEMRN